MARLEMNFFIINSDDKTVKVVFSSCIFWLHTIMRVVIILSFSNVSQAFTRIELIYVCSHFQNLNSIMIIW